MSAIQQALLGYGGAGAVPFSAVVALLHMNGTNGQTTFPDTSTNTKTFTAAGNAQLSTAQIKFGATSLFLDGTGDYIEAPDSADWDLGTGDFTFEAWVYTTTIAAGQGTVFARQEAGSNMVMQIRRNAANLDFIARNTGGGGLVVITATTFFAINTWYHLAVSRNGSTVRIFKDGTQVATGTASNTLDSNRPMSIGVVNDTTLAGFWTGYIDEARITKGFGRYTSNFTAPTAEFPDS